MSPDPRRVDRRSPRNRVRAGLLSLLLLLAAGALGASGQDPLPKPVRAMPFVYGGKDGGMAGYEYYAPTPAADDAKPALVVFIHSRFWRELHAKQRVYEQLAPVLVEAGHAVAIVTHRFRPHPTPIRDAAASVAYLLDQADALGFDPTRVFLAGHSSGGHLATLLATDPRYLAVHGHAPAELAGVIAISGIFDLAKESGISEEEDAIYAEAFPKSKDRREASPQALVEAGGAGSPPPPLLALVADRDVPGYLGAAKAITAALREKRGAAAELFIVPRTDHATILDLRDRKSAARRHILEFIEARPDRLPESWEILSTWRKPPFTSEPFFELGAAVDEHPADDAFIFDSNRPFVRDLGRPPRIFPRSYESIELDVLLNALVEKRGEARVGRGDYLVLENVRGERAVWKLDALRPYGPQVVVGMDGERNLFRVTDLYHTLRRYTWQQPEPEEWTLARPLGAFVRFVEQPPRELGVNTFGRYGLTVDSFRLVESDPRAGLAGLDPELRTYVEKEKACTSCHAFMGSEARAGHLLARDGSRVGGFALPLVEYPKDVWKRYVYEQARVAEEIGADAVELNEPMRTKLFEAVNRAR